VKLIDPHVQVMPVSQPCQFSQATFRSDEFGEPATSNCMKLLR